MNNFTPGLPRFATLAPDAPDFTILAHAANGIYVLSTIDCAQRLGGRTCGKLPSLLDSHGSALFSATSALAQITNSTIVETLMNRFGYSSRAAVHASGRVCQIAIETTDPELTQIAGTLAAATLKERELLFASLRFVDQSRYGRLLKELNRFETTWQHVASDSQAVHFLMAWATELLPRCNHDGPVHARRISLSSHTSPAVTSAA